jgi:gliding motility-associated protein GldL
MTKYSKYNLVYRLQRWMDSVPGQTFLNYAYSWGASVVILGTLFKLTHLPGANVMLFLGMGTEVAVFFISAFDRPFDKTQDGMELPTHLDEDEENQSVIDGNQTTAAELPGTNVTGGGTIIIGGGFGHGGSAGVQEQSSDTPDEDQTPKVAAATSPAAVGAAVSTEQIAAAVNNTAWVEQQQQVSPEMEEATNNYVDQLKKLTDMLSKVSEQSERLTRDSEEMENLNRTLTGICKIYEMQLKGVSQQVGTIDQINEQSRKMAGQIEQLNKIYARMIEAMTVNMRAAAPTAPIDPNV